ncbi:MAG: hypothetical protein PHW77_05875 [Eubacteriales bacterium]|nr:hypothetical protein [Eubacteriales bacterium]
MILEGFFSDKHIDNGFIKLDTCLKIGLAYISAENFVLGNADVYLYIKEMPDFEDVYNYFMTCKTKCLKLNKKQDICLSLLYNPYFDKFYYKLKDEMNNLSNSRLKFLKKYLIADLADPIINKSIIDYDMTPNEYLVKHDIFNRSNELLKLISS